MLVTCSKMVVDARKVQKHHLHAKQYIQTIYLVLIPSKTLEKYHLQEESVEEHFRASFTCMFSGVQNTFVVFDHNSGLASAIPSRF